MLRPALASLALFASAACGPAMQIDRAVTLIPPECSASDATLAEGLFDIGTSAADANDYDAALVVGAGDAKDITYDAVEVFFTTDADRGDELQLGQVPGVPINANNASRISVGGTSTSDVLFARIATKEQAALLQTEPFVANAIQAGGSARIIANVRVLGKTAGGGDVTSQLFPIPLELCAGCLIAPPECGVDATGTPIQPIANEAQCTIGDDVPTFVCPAG